MLGDTLKDFRDRLRISQTELAAKLDKAGWFGANQQTVARIERAAGRKTCKRKFHTVELQAAATVLGVSLETAVVYAGVLPEEVEGRAAHADGDTVTRALGAFTAALEDAPVAGEPPAPNVATMEAAAETVAAVNAPKDSTWPDWAAEGAEEAVGAGEIEQVMGEWDG